MHIAMLLLMCAAAPADSAPMDTLLVSVNAPPAPLVWGANMERLSPSVVLWRYDKRYHSAEEITRQLLAQPWVRWVEPNLPLHLQGADAVWAQRDLRPAQGYLRKLWHLLRRSGAQESPVRPRVAIVDTGIDAGHPDLEGNVGEGINLLYEPRCDAACPDDQREPGTMDYNGHGTAVAGLIGARHNSIGVDGLNDNVDLLPVKAFDAQGSGSLATVLRALRWAQENNVHLLNLSFGTPVASRLLGEAVAEVQRAGVVVVAAAGNQGAGDVLFPAALTGVIAVGSRNGEGISAFSNVGQGVTVYAPGEALMTTQSSALGPNVYGPLTGTSAAAAYLTGLLSHVVASGRDARATHAYLRQHTLPLRREEQMANTVNAPLLLADLQDTTVRALTVLAWDAPAYLTPGTPLRTRVTLINSGNAALPPLPLHVRVQRGATLETIDAGTLPGLAPGKTVERRLDLALPPPPGGRADREDIVLRLALGQNAALGEVVQLDAPAVATVVTAIPTAHVSVDRIWLKNLSPDDDPLLAVKVRNDGNVPLPAQTLQAFLRAATHEGVFSVPAETLTHLVKVPRLAPGAAETLILATTQPLPVGTPFSVQVSLTYGADGSGHGALQSFERTGTGELLPQYSGDAHVGSVATAVDLLALAGFEMPDVHGEEAPYLGSSSLAGMTGRTMQWGPSFRGWSWQDDWARYPAQAKTLLDGARACDAVDVAFGDHAAAIWNTHYWVVDENDHVGLGDHSALDKVLALMLGGHGSKIEDGAIAAYKNGDKSRAWWLVGHAAHLLGDISTGAHTINRNWHGVVGDPFHDWLGHGGRYQGWTAAHAAAAGGMVNPYQYEELRDTAERLRFLTYSTAQVGSAFPWRRTRYYAPAKGPREGEGNRVLGGDLPHYENLLAPLFASLPSHPLLVRDIDLDEVQNADGTCAASAGVGKNQTRADCWEGGDGHVCMSNTTGGGNDADGDLSRIADASYVYALRSISGLLYLFARETGQL